LNLNSVFFAGNLTRDPELKYTPSGTAICNFSVAQNKSWVSKDGAKHEKTNYVECTMFGRRGEVINDFFKKGSNIFVQGELDFQTWEKDGANRSTLKLVCSNFEFTGSKKDQGTQEQKSYTNVKPGDADIDEKEIPF